MLVASYGESLHGSEEFNGIPPHVLQMKESNFNKGNRNQVEPAYKYLQEKQTNKDQPNISPKKNWSTKYA